jgi:hypothetical protein
MTITAYYIIKDKICVLYEKKIDEQDIGYGLKLCAILSEKLNKTVIYSTNHDSDVLIIYVYKNGKEIFLYNSDPEYFGDKKLPPSMNKIDNLLLEYDNINKNDFLKILTTKETFSEDIHYKIADKLSLPEYSVNYGYNIFEYMDEAELSEMENEYEIKVEKIDNEEKVNKMFEKIINGELEKLQNYLGEGKERKSKSVALLYQFIDKFNKRLYDNKSINELTSKTGTHFPIMLDSCTRLDYSLSLGEKEFAFVISFLEYLKYEEGDVINESADNFENRIISSDIMNELISGLIEPKNNDVTITFAIHTEKNWIYVFERLF